MNSITMKWPVEVLVFGALVAIVPALGLPTMSAMWLTLLITLVCFVIGAIRLAELGGAFDRVCSSFGHVDHHVDHLEATTQGSQVDPWALQRDLMYISNQAIGDPGRPAINTTVLLYYALILEELGEGFRTLARVGTPKVGTGFYDLNGGVPMSWTEVGNQLIDFSTNMRKSIAEMQFRPIPLSIQDAADMLDDLTDIMVVTSGATVAAGLPGPAGYLEVSSSNLSKANPATGLIDKDASGKWIKGANYRMADLRSVVSQSMNNQQ
jgi:hypothetical protein